jgi:hypothetical protein
MVSGVNIPRCRIAVLLIALIMSRANVAVAQRAAAMPSGVTQTRTASVEADAVVSLRATPDLGAPSLAAWTHSTSRAPRWYRYAAYGAGAGTLVGIAAVLLAPCDQVCRSDTAGRVEKLGFIPAGAVVGAAAGALVGAVADVAHAVRKARVAQGRRPAPTGGGAP